MLLRDMNHLAYNMRNQLDRITYDKIHSSKLIIPSEDINFILKTAIKLIALYSYICVFASSVNETAECNIVKFILNRPT